MPPLLIVLSAPSGGGKTTIARELVARRQDLRYSVSATTRPPRAGEQNGRDYHFLSRDQFEADRRAGQFLEWAEYNDHLYGTLARDVEALLAAGYHVIMDIEVQGARQLREHRRDLVGIFIVPPSAEVLLERLGGRQADAPEQLRWRLRRAVDELRDASLYDYLVVNDDQERAVAQVSAIIDAEGCRIGRSPGAAEQVATLMRDIGRLVDQMER
jgi:guanylate kinase